MTLTMNGVGVLNLSPASACVDWRKRAPGAGVRVVGCNIVDVVEIATSTLTPTLSRLQEREQNKTAKTT